MDQNFCDVLARPTIFVFQEIDAKRNVAVERDADNIFFTSVLSQYVDLGVDELQQERLPQLLAIKYHSQMEGIQALGGTEKARSAFIGFQRELYSVAKDHGAASSKGEVDG